MSHASKSCRNVLFYLFNYGFKLKPFNTQNLSPVFCLVQISDLNLRFFDSIPERTHLSNPYLIHVQTLFYFTCLCQQYFLRHLSIYENLDDLMKTPP